MAASVPGYFVPVFTIASVNVNGVRAAARRGGIDWLVALDPDVICLQEVRAPDDILSKALADGGLGHLNIAHSESSAPGRSGVAILSKHRLSNVRIGVGPKEFADCGRWVEATVDSPLGPLRVVSVYVHTGEAQTPKQEEKYRFLDAMTKRIKRLSSQANNCGGHLLVAGDLNVAHTENDIKNWRGNRGKAGFLEGEREYLSRWFATSLRDLGRTAAGDVAGPYTWWTWRGQAFDTDTGWRIDYLLGSPGLESAMTSLTVGRAASYAERWSDHSPVVVTFEASSANE
ncbi:MAG: exodeoxyribonuclease III [Candidatus Nanopelagicales bacterium]